MPTLNLPLINAHTHAAMVNPRNVTGDLKLEKWLSDADSPLEANMENPSFIYDQTMDTIDEMRANGIAAFMDMYFYENEVGRACEEMGMPVVLGERLVDSKGQWVFDKDLKTTEMLLEKYKNHSFVKVSVAPYSPYTVNKDNLIKAKELARKYDAIYQINVAETNEEVNNSIKEHNLTPIEYLESIGVLDEKTVLIHCVWLTDNDISIIAKNNCRVVHCPFSSLRLGSGVAPIEKLLKAGVIVALGTDGPASSNQLDIWEKGKFDALSKKGINFDPTILPPKELIKMATVNGMKVLGFESLLGKTIKDIEEEIEREDFVGLYN